MLRINIEHRRHGPEDKVGLVYRQVQQPAQAASGAPDCSLTLGRIAKELKAVTARLDAMERALALASIPAEQAAELRRKLHLIGQDARSGLAHSQIQLNGTVRELRGMIGSVRDRQDQQQWLWTEGAWKL